MTPFFFPHLYLLQYTTFNNINTLNNIKEVLPPLTLPLAFSLRLLPRELGFAICNVDSLCCCTST